MRLGPLADVVPDLGVEGPDGRGRAEELGHLPAVVHPGLDLQDGVRVGEIAPGIVDRFAAPQEDRPQAQQRKTRFSHRLSLAGRGRPPGDWCTRGAAYPWAADPRPLKSVATAATLIAPPSHGCQGSLPNAMPAWNPFRLQPVVSPADGLYAAIVERSRDARFYAAHGVPDSLDGRFEMVALHAYLVLRRLRAGGPAAEQAGPGAGRCAFCRYGRQSCARWARAIWAWASG